MKRILVVDDSRVTREVIKLLLIAGDVTLVEAVNGVEALRKVRSDPPDLVLADLQMPELDGYGLCEALRSDPRTRGVPVVILTSSRGDEILARARAAGAREVLHKPVQPEPLHAAVQRNIAQHAS
jgi:CheY-like chemotaxis protein